MRKLTFLIIIIYFLSISVITMAEEEHYINVAVIDSGIGENIEVLDYSKILKGKSYIEGITSYIDKIGHGTAVAGLIQSNAPNINIVPLMYYCQYPSGVTLNGGIDGICRAIYDAVDVYKCKIINISSGIYTENNELKDAVEYAESKGVIVISAVGNDRISAKDRVFYPAAYSTVIGVGAVDNDFKVGDFSQRNESVMTVAYGVDVEVISIRNSSHYVTVSGTSFAAANFCGLAASVIGEYPEITPKEFRELIECSSIDLGEPGYDITYGYGVVDKDIILKDMKR